MLLKEKGYDEFLAKKIAKADADIQAGRVHSLEEVDASIQYLLARKERELVQQALENTIYA